MLGSRGLIKGCRDAAVSAANRVRHSTKRHAEETIGYSPPTTFPKGVRPAQAPLSEGLPPLDAISAADDAFLSALNAEVVVGAEEYYRGMFDPKGRLRKLYGFGGDVLVVQAPPMSTFWVTLPFFGAGHFLLLPWCLLLLSSPLFEVPPG